MRCGAFSCWIRCVLGGCLAWLSMACQERANATETPNAGGEATLFDSTRDAFSQPVAGMSAAQRATFFVGNSLFNQNWVSAPASVPSRDGLGPLFNASSCSACHFKDGRGHPPRGLERFQSLLLRLSVPGSDARGAPAPHPVYGGQLQELSLAGVAAEGAGVVTYISVSGAYDDGEPYELLRPSYEIQHLGYGDLSSEVRVSPRVAPSVFGLGLLEAVSDATLKQMSDEHDRDGDGVSGRVNRVWDHAAGSFALGRFGWKSEQPNLRQQIAAALLNDMGLTTALFPEQALTESQDSARALPTGGTPEVTTEQLDALTFYARTLAVPARRAVADDEVLRGQALFERLGCANCHRTTLQTAFVSDLGTLSGQVIHPYTDLLLHDMGPGLTDERPVFSAAGQEWRTPALWGLGLISKVNGHTRLLHDGRARNAAEAVLWHGGEAIGAQRAFKRLERGERASVIAFLESL